MTHKSLKHIALILPMLMLPVLGVAKLDSQLGKDEAGNTTLTVKNDSQKGLPPAQLGISPAKVDGTIKLSARSVRLDKSLTFYNYSDKPKELKLTLQDKQVADTSMKDWLLINPRTITIPAKGQQTIRLSFRPPKSLSVGRYQAVLFIEQQVKDPLLYDEDGKGVTMQIGSRYGLPVDVEITP